MRFLSYFIVLLSFYSSYSFITRNYIKKSLFYRNHYPFIHRSEEGFQKLYAKRTHSSEDLNYSNYHKDLELKTLRQRVADLSDHNYTLEENYIKASGPGGQKINKSSICDQLIYSSPNSKEKIIIKCKKHRTLLQNRIEATKLLISRLEETKEREQMEADREEYIEYIKSKPLSEEAKRKRMKDKKYRSLKKQLRSKIIHESEY